MRTRLPEVSESLAEQVGQGSGQGQFRIVLRLDDIGREVEFVLPQGIDSTPKQRSALKLVGGVTAVPGTGAGAVPAATAVPHDAQYCALASRPLPHRVQNAITRPRAGVAPARALARGQWLPIRTERIAR